MTAQGNPHYGLSLLEEAILEYLYTRQKGVRAVEVAHDKMKGREVHSRRCGPQIAIIVGLVSAPSGSDCRVRWVAAIRVLRRLERHHSVTGKV